MTISKSNFQGLWSSKTSWKKLVLQDSTPLGMRLNASPPTLIWMYLFCHDRVFFDACDGIFLNYTWNAAKLASSVTAAGDRQYDVYVGVDVFGRNCFGGGGYNTNKVSQVILFTFSPSSRLWFCLLCFQPLVEQTNSFLLLPTPLSPSSLFILCIFCVLSASCSFHFPIDCFYSVTPVHLFMHMCCHLAFEKNVRPLAALKLYFVVILLFEIKSA